jgi:hypothetical protein
MRCGVKLPGAIVPVQARTSAMFRKLEAHAAASSAAALH